MEGASFTKTSGNSQIKRKMLVVMREGSVRDRPHYFMKDDTLTIL